MQNYERVHKRGTHATPRGGETSSRDVAKAAKQLGKLAAAVTALVTILKEVQPDAIAQHPECAAVIEDLLSKQNQIELKKIEVRKTVEAEALDALIRLKRADSHAFKSLVEELHEQSEGEAARDGN